MSTQGEAANQWNGVATAGWVNWQQKITVLAPGLTMTIVQQEGP